MFDPKKKRQLKDVTVKDVIKELEKENPDARFSVIGDEWFYIHVEGDGSVVTLDTEDLCDEYPEEGGDDTNENI